MSATRPLYVAIIPAWLTEVLERKQVPLETALDFSKLETIVSLDDVCFYFAYLKNIRRYVGSLFDDMKTADLLPANQSWLVSKGVAVDQRIESTRRYYADPVMDLTGTNVPQVVRMTNYVPVALNADCLALVGRGIASANEFNQTNLIQSALAELEKLRTWDSVKTLKVFLAYTQCASDAA